jgi:uncharacterized membrane protein
MRRIVGYVLVGLGVALLVLGVAARVAIYPALAKAPATYPSADDVKAGTDPAAGVQESTGNVNVFVARNDTDGKPLVGVRKLDVTARRTTQSVTPSASVGQDVYWKTQVDTTSAELGGPPLNTTREGVCFDRVTGEAATGCLLKGYRADNGRVDQIDEREGLFFKFPFDTQKTTYRFWDGLSGKAYDAAFDGTDTIDGMGVYRFVQHIDSVLLRSQDVPGVVFGGAPSSPAVTAEDRYSNTRTLWVEPETGTIIKGLEDQNRVLVAGAQTVPAFVGSIGYTDATVAANVKLTRSNADGLHLVRVVLPVALVIVGLLLALAGLVLVFLLHPRENRGRRALGRPVDPDTGTVVDLRVGQPQRADGV